MTSSTGRVFGCCRGERPGPTLLVLGGVHGNEPSGLAAMRRTVEWLERDRPPLRGEVVLVAGNLAALERRERFLDRDLNRGWSAASLEELRGGAASHAPTAVAEDREQVELAATIDAIVAASRGEVIVLDLHTTSADGVPFVVTGTGSREVAFARHFPLPVILGLFGAIEGTIAQYLCERGIVSLAVEGGQNASPRSVAHHAAVLAIGLVAAGLLEEAEVPGLDAHRATLERTRAGVPHVIRVWWRHAINPGDGFEMAPGFANIDRVTRGQFLARDRTGPILAPEDGWLVMPLYQGQGDDGFFLARDVS